MRIESGTNTVCSAPCSVFMHYNSDSGFPCNSENSDSSSFINAGVMPTFKSRLCDELQQSASETSNLLSTSSSHDSYSENTESKDQLRASATYDASNAIDIPQVLFFGQVIQDERSFKENADINKISLHSGTPCRLLTQKHDNQRELECRVDNILHASEDGDSKVLVSDSRADYVKKDMEFTDKVKNNFDKVNESIIQAESGDDKEDRKTGESHCISKKSNVNTDSLLLHNACNSASVNNVSNVKSQLPSHINNNSPSTSLLYSLSQDGNPSFLDSESIVKDETLNLKIQADIVDCSLASLACGSSSENKSSCISNNEFSTTIGTKGEYSYGSTKIDDICQDARLGTDCKKLFDGFSKECHANELETTCDTVLDAAAKGENQHMQLQVSVVDENYESDVALDDVKVCDICGDAGREDHLAICSRCSDGAEHTYCMREKLDEVPEGEWLCEECKVKETEDKNVNEGATVYGRLKSTQLNDIDQKFFSGLIPKQAHKMDATRSSLNARGSVKGLQDPHVSTRRQIDCLDERKASGLNGILTEEASPRKKSVLSRQISFKDQVARKVKMAGNESSEVHPEKGYETTSISKTYFNSKSFKGLPPRHSPRRNLSRSASFGNSIINSKVKTVLENAPPPKQKNTREPSINDSRKESLIKPSTKTTFKNSTLGLTNTELANKNPSLEPCCIEDLKALKEVKEQIAVEKMNFYAKGHSIVRASAAIISNHSLKFDVKHVQSDGNRNTFSETSTRSGSNGHDADDFGSNEGKRLISLSSKNIESSSCKYDANNPKGAIKEVIRRTVGADRSYGNVEIASPRTVQSTELGHKDNRTRDYTNVTGPRSYSLGSNRTIYYRRDNDTVCSSQDKFGGSAPKTYAEQKLSEVEKKGNKWREVVDAAMSRSRVLKSEKSDTLKEFPAANTDIICEGLLKHTKGAFNQKSLVVESNLGNARSKDLDDVSSKTLAIGSVPPGELSVKPSYKVNGTRDTPATELSAKPETFPGDINMLANPLNGSAVPKLECIWQGSFTVIGTGSCTKIFFGIQAHLSTCASHRVYQLAAKVPGNVQLEEVSHNSSWPLQILRTGPQEENIALFFFARDIESYDKSYKNLVAKMHRNDLALKGNIDGTELLIFTSIKLPMNSQRWNRMHFLWGMFRGKRKYYLPVIGDQNNPLSANPISSLAPISDISNARSLETNSKLNNLSDSISSNAVPGESSNDLDLRCVSELSSNIEEKTRKTMDSPIQNLLNQEPSVLQVTQEQKPSFFFGTSSGTKSETSKAVIESPNLRLQMPKTRSFSHDKDNGFCQLEESSIDCTNIKAGKPSVLIHDIGVESINRSASSVPSVSHDCKKGASFTIEGKNIEKDTTPAVATITDNDQKRNVFEADLFGVANRKRERSCSLEKTNEKPKNLVATVLPRDRPSWFPVEGEREQKKTCFVSVAVPLGSSPKVHPLYSGILCQKQPPESLCSDDTLTPLISETKERWFFPIDLNPPVVNAECLSLTHTIPSEQGKEDEIESSSPDLELALGGKIKSTKPFSFTSLFHSVDGSKQDMRPGLSGDGDDASASLSLSL